MYYPRLIQKEIELKLKTSGAIEIKLGGEKLIEEGASNLIRLQNKIIEKSSEKKPSFLMVLTAISETYVREDGVVVAPVTSLKP